MQRALAFAAAGMMALTVPATVALPGVASAQSYDPCREQTRQQANKGTIVGGLVGALAGPAGSVLGAALGATTGLIGDAVTDDIGQDFVARVATDLYPGEAALIFEANEESTRYVDDIVRDMGGRIHRGDLG